MPKQIIEIAENGKYLSSSRGFLIIKEKNKELGKIPLDAIHCLILSAEGITLSKSVFTRLADLNTPIVVCGKNYAPVSIAHPLTSHYKSLSVVEKQIACSSVLKKRLWQSIVKQKIKNQSTALKNIGMVKESVKVSALQAKVKSGDKDNCEAYAARLYWVAFFGNNFTRNFKEEGINSFLNYGYAVLRSSVIRAICAAGLLPILGLHHKNKLNAYCLADDLMEPLRPLVDLKVKKIIDSSIKESFLELSPEHKRCLCTLLTKKVKIENEYVYFIAACQKMAFTLVNSFMKNENKLRLPCLA